MSNKTPEQKAFEAGFCCGMMVGLFWLFIITSVMGLSVWITLHKAGLL